MLLTDRSEYSNKVHLCVKRNGVQTSYLLHKSCVFAALDSRWLNSPEGHESQTAAFLKGHEVYEHATAPRGYGFVVIDFDKRMIQSYQSYKNIGHILIDEFGYWGGASPIWMDWKGVVNDAFNNGCVVEVLYAPNGGGKTVHTPLPYAALNHQTLALRFASHQKLIGYKTLGFRFSPPGWKLSHVPVPNSVLARKTVSQRMLERLRNVAIETAPGPQWAGFVQTY